MLCARTVGYFAAVGRIGRGLQKVFHAIDRVIQEVCIVSADINMNLAGEVRANSCPVTLQNRCKIVVFPPIFSHAVIDLASYFIKDGPRIPVFPHWSVDCLPDIELFAAAAMVAKRQFVGVEVLGGEESMAEVITHGGLSDTGVCTFDEESVLVLIKIYICVRMKINRVRTCGKRTVVVVRMENLDRECLPSPS